MRNKIITAIFGIILLGGQSFGATVVATIAGRPITDTDITARTELMNKQGEISTTNRKQALNNIIDDYIKLEYAGNFKAVPSDADVKKELTKMNLGDMSPTVAAMAKTAVAANIAWQIVIARTIVPTIDVSLDDINAEKQSLERDRGLPIEMTIIRLIDIPEGVAQKLSKPKTCDDAMKIATDLGGAPQKFTAAQYELSDDIRTRVVGLPKLTWGTRVDNSVLLVCSSQKMSDYGKLDEIIKQNTIYKKAMFSADGQLKQLRRRAVIVIKEPAYK